MQNHFTFSYYADTLSSECVLNFKRGIQMLNIKSSICLMASCGLLFGSVYAVPQASQPKEISVLVRNVQPVAPEVSTDFCNQMMKSFSYKVTNDSSAFPDIEVSPIHKIVDIHRLSETPLEHVPFVTGVYAGTSIVNIGGKTEKIATYELYERNTNNFSWQSIILNKYCTATATVEVSQ